MTPFWWFILGEVAGIATTCAGAWLFFARQAPKRESGVSPGLLGDDDFEDRPKAAKR